VCRAVSRSVQIILLPAMAESHHRGLRPPRVDRAREALALGVDVNSLFEGRTAFMVCFLKLLALDAGEVLPMPAPRKDKREDRYDKISHEEVMHLLVAAGAGINARVGAWVAGAWEGPPCRTTAGCG
jgi:hypothetical protein